MIKHYSVMARQGKPYLALVLLLAVALVYRYGWAATLPVWLLPLLVVYMFRDPNRSVPSNPYGIISPVDGHITTIDTVHDHYLDRDALRIRIRMNRLGVYTTRSPIEGKIMQQWYITDRAQLRAGDPAFAQWLQTDEAEDLVLAIYPAALQRQPHCQGQTGERVGQGQRCSFISFGTRFELYLPADARLHVEAGRGVIGGVSLLADFAGH